MFGLAVQLLVLEGRLVLLALATHEDFLVNCWVELEVYLHEVEPEDLTNYWWQAEGQVLAR